MNIYRIVAAIRDNRALSRADKYDLAHEIAEELVAVGLMPDRYRKLFVAIACPNSPEAIANRIKELDNERIR